MNEKLEAANINRGDAKTKKELNEKTKEIKNLNQKLTDNLKKLRDETNL